MSTKKEVETTNEEVVKVNVNEVSVAIENGSIGDLLAKSKRAGYSLTSEYLSMEKGETRRFAVMDLNRMSVADTSEGAVEGANREIEVLLMVDENGETVTAGQTVLVNSIKKYIPCKVEIVCKGAQKMAGGKSYTAFDVFPLND